MKARKYFNAYSNGDIFATTGYPLELPGFDGVEFAVVRAFPSRGWQVIHVRSGRAIFYRSRPEDTRGIAIESAKATIDSAIKKKGWDTVLMDAKRAKTPAVIAALKTYKEALCKTK